MKVCKISSREIGKTVCKEGSKHLGKTLCEKGSKEEECVRARKVERN